jgi:cyclase
MQRVTDNVYVETGFQGCNPGFVVTSEGVVLIDTPMLPMDAMKWREEIAKIGTIRYIVNTEPHPDHITGNYFFDGTLVAHEGTRMALQLASLDQLKEMLRDTLSENLTLIGDYRYRLPDITFSQQLTFYLGNHTFKLINMPGHTPYQVAVYIPSERVVFTSDNVVYKLPALLHQSLPFEWLDSLKRLQQLDADILVPGHGKVCDRSYLPEMSAVIQKWIDAVTSAIQQGWSVEEAKVRVPLVDHYLNMATGDKTMLRRFLLLSIERLYQVLKN